MEELDKGFSDMWRARICLPQKNQDSSSKIPKALYLTNLKCLSPRLSTTIERQSPIVGKLIVVKNDVADKEKLNLLAQACVTVHDGKYCTAKHVFEKLVGQYDCFISFDNEIFLPQTCQNNGFQGFSKVRQSTNLSHNGRTCTNSLCSDIVWLEAEDNSQDVKTIVQKDSASTNNCGNEFKGYLIGYIPLDHSVSEIATANGLKETEYKELCDGLGWEPENGKQLRCKYVFFGDFSSDKTPCEHLLQHSCLSISGLSGCSAFQDTGNIGVHIGRQKNKLVIKHESLNDQ